MQTIRVSAGPIDNPRTDTIEVHGQLSDLTPAAAREAVSRSGIIAPAHVELIDQYGNRIAARRVKRSGGTVRIMPGPHS